MPSDRSAASPRTKRLSREGILAAALDGALSADGNVSMRSIATRLGVSAMALYNHVEGIAEIRQHILARLFGSEMASLELTARMDGEEALRALLSGQYRMALRHADLFKVFIDNCTMPEVLAFQEHLFEALARCGVPVPLHRTWSRIFGSFVHGAATMRRAGDAAWSRHDIAYADLDGNRYPRTAAAVGAAPHTTDALFASELDALIAAMRASGKTALPATARAAPA